MDNPEKYGVLHKIILGDAWGKYMGSLKKWYYAVPNIIFLLGSPYISVLITLLSIFITNLSCRLI